MDDEKKWTLYGIGTPAEVLYNPYLSQTDKLLFGIIQNLSKRKEGCTCSNDYLAKLMFLNKQSISNAIRTLVEFKYLNVIYDNKKFPYRKIYTNPEREIIYQELVNTFEDNYQEDNEDLKEKLYGCINKIIGGYKKTYNKENNKESSKECSSKDEHECSGEHSLPILPVKIIRRRQTLSVKPKTLRETLSEVQSSTEKTFITPLKTSPLVQEVFDYWQELGLRMPKIGTKSYNKCVSKTASLFGGAVLRKKFTMDQVKTAIVNFSFAALDPDFEPHDIGLKKTLSKMLIDDFIYNSFRQNGNASLFTKYLNNPPKALRSKQIIDDNHPAITNKLKKFYREEVLGNAKVDLTQRDENCFRAGADKLKQFHRNNESRFNKFMSVRDSDLAEWLCESIKSDCHGDLSKVSPGWFASNMTFNRRLPAFLFKQSILESRDNIYHSFNTEEDVTIDLYDE